MEKETLSCGHPKECYYFHPALIGGLRHRCCACDDPNGNTRAVQELRQKGILKEECKHEDQFPMPESLATVCKKCGQVFVDGEPWDYKSGNIMEWVNDLVDARCGSKTEV